MRNNATQAALLVVVRVARVCFALVDSSAIEARELSMFVRESTRRENRSSLASTSK